MSHFNRFQKFCFALCILHMFNLGRACGGSDVNILPGASGPFVAVMFMLLLALSDGERDRFTKLIRALHEENVRLVAALNERSRRG